MQENYNRLKKLMNNQMKVQASRTAQATKLTSVPELKLKENEFVEHEITNSLNSSKAMGRAPSHRTRRQQEKESGALSERSNLAKSGERILASGDSIFAAAAPASGRKWSIHSKDGKTENY